MKKRNILTAVLALALVAVVAVGATMAYLTDTDDQVVNTFTFANGMEVTITEPTPSPVHDEKITEKDPTHPGKGFNYENVVPGQDLNKAPEISTTTDVDAYVFVKISGANPLVSISKTDGMGVDLSKWTAIDADTPDQYGNGIYYTTVTVTEDTKGQAKDLGSIFKQVTVGEKDLLNTTAGEALDLGDIMIDVYEIQMNGITLDQAKAEAQTHFNPPAEEPAA